MKQLFKESLLCGVMYYENWLLCINELINQNNHYRIQQSYVEVLKEL